MRARDPPTKERVEYAAAHGWLEALKAAQSGSVVGSASTSGLEEGLWLRPIEDHRRVGSSREGMLEGFSLGNCLLLVDDTGRLFREGKATIARGVDEILGWIGTSAERWQTRLETLRIGRWFGRVIGSSRARLRATAEQWGVRRLPNQGGCPVI